MRSSAKITLRAKVKELEGATMDAYELHRKFKIISFAISIEEMSLSKAIQGSHNQIINTTLRKIESNILEIFIKTIKPPYSLRSKFFNALDSLVMCGNEMFFLAEF